MLLKIKTNKTLAVMNAENIVYTITNRTSDNQHLEISCKNADIYVFSYGAQNKNDFKKFEEFCENIINVMITQHETYSCTLNLSGVKFEKHSLCSQIE